MLTRLRRSVRRRPLINGAGIATPARPTLDVQRGLEPGAPQLDPASLPQLQRQLGNQAVSRLVQLGRTKNTTFKAKQQQKKTAKILDTSYDSWNDFYTKTKSYLANSSRERLAWLKKAEAMDLDPPPKLKGAHSSTGAGEFDTHVLEPLDVYIEARVKPAWNNLGREEREEMKVAAEELGR